MMRLKLLFGIWLLCVDSPVEAEHPVLAILQKSPEVHSARVAIAADSGPVIIHIRDWHWVPYEFVLAEGGNQDDFFRLLEQVEQVQSEQYPILKRLVAAGHKDVFGEAITPDVVPIYRTVCRSLWESRRAKPDDITELLKTPNVLSVGTPGRLLADGLIDHVRATESNASLKLTQPLDEAGNLLEVSDDAMEQREDYIVRQLLKAADVATVVLGGGHNLTDNVKRLADGKATLIVITTRAYLRIAQEQKAP